MFRLASFFNEMFMYGSSHPSCDGNDKIEQLVNLFRVKMGLVTPHKELSSFHVLGYKQNSGMLGLLNLLSFNKGLLIKSESIQNINTPSMKLRVDEMSTTACHLGFKFFVLIVIGCSAIVSTLIPL